MSLPHLLLLPGWGMERDVWAPLLAELNDEVQPSFVDWRELNSISEIKSRVVKLLDSISGQRCILLGWSLGALAAIDVASSSSKVQGIILIGSTSRFVSTDNHKASADNQKASADNQKASADNHKTGWDPRVLGRMKIRLQREKEDALQDFYRLMFSPSEIEEGQLDRFLHWRNHRFEGDRTDSLLHGLDYLLESDFRDRLNRLKVPVLLIHGEKDFICSPKAAEYIAQHTAAETAFTFLDHTGHIPFFTKPDLCAQSIKTFIRAGG